MSWLDRDRIMACLQELSDRQLQERLWMGRIPAQQSSFVEAVEGLFTDSGLEDALDGGETGFSAEAETKLRELEHALSEVDTKGGPAKVIDDPVMPRVRALAADVLELLKHAIE